MMFRSMKNPRALSILTILLLAVAVAPSAQSVPYGISGVQNDGCSCHSLSPNSEVVPSLEGLPDELEAGATYTLNISFTGGPSGQDPGAYALGGFHLWASHGALAAIDDKVTVNEDGSLTHAGVNAFDEGTGNDQSALPPKRAGENLVKFVG